MNYTIFEQPYEHVNFWQKPNRNPVDKINGRVNTIVETKFEVKKSSVGFVKGEVISTFECIYNEKGLILKEKYCNQDNNKSYAKLYVRSEHNVLLETLTIKNEYDVIGRSVYTYYENNNCVTEDFFHNDIFLETRTLNKFKDGLLIESSKFSFLDMYNMGYSEEDEDIAIEELKDKKEFIYNSNGKILNYKEFESGNSKRKEIEYSYNKKNTCNKIFINIRNIAKSKVILFFNKNGQVNSEKVYLRLTEEDVFSDSYRLTAVYKYKYINENRIELQEHTLDEGELTFSTKREKYFEFDEIGNFRKCVYFINDIADSVYERNIVYF